ncbi:CYTH and CHAD domain-containing protein [Pseudorhodoferax sp. Leaf267]|uniref:CYTH and CHAD domain-containing protein n=1 Tax=Pseudorhodoferax sp. Leaf267 TaxID=1736316 RepID=UPI000A7B017B|nr:CYTH and CHAD domain-containing protein [Pseudorhodoferax sp. Leaf267]
MEIEFKFQVPAERLEAVEAAMLGASSTRTHLQARYYDTEGGDLAAHGVVLRLRKEGRNWVQTAKAAGEGPLHRLEHNVDLGPARKSQPLAALPARHAGTPVGERLARALGAQPAPLVEVYATDIWRIARHEQFADSTVELALDQGRVLAPSADGSGERSAQVCELELELVDGNVDDLATLARLWAERHGLWFSTVSKSERGMRLALGQSTRPAVKASAPRLDENGGFPDGPTLQRAVVAACLAQILPNASEIAAGSLDAAQIHQARVGLRRLRTALRELQPLGAGLDEAWLPALVRTFRALGATRDRQQLVDKMQPRLVAAGGPVLTLPEDTTPQASPGEAVRASDFQAALVGLIGFAATPRAAPGASPKQTRRILRTRLSKLHAQLLRDGHAFEALPPDAQHRARKRLKRLRYLAEFVGAAFGDRRAARYTDALSPVQDVLGAYYDEVVAQEAYRAAADREPRAWFAVGWLLARQSAHARECGEALKSIAEARKFWNKKK